MSESSTMPLIILAGFPTSGKSTRAKQLHRYLSERIQSTSGDAPPKYRLHLISDQSLSISRSVYDLSTLPAHVRSANASEKDARASIYGAVKRVLSDKDIVILDGLNYIKGWRYQLHCEAKAVRTPSCILQIGCGKDKAKEVNEDRLRKEKDGEALQENSDAVMNEEEAPYSPENWENLVFRYEEPNPMTRWDSPLFTLVWEDDEAQTKQVFDSLWDAVAGDGRKIIKPNQATVQRSRDAGGDYLYILDKETQDIVKRILDQQSDDGGDEIVVPKGTANDETLSVELPAGKKVGLPQLQRLRRAFMGLNRGGIGLESVGNLSGPSRIRESFVRYLNDSFDADG
ncbi:putative Chromatin associated protein KTI12 [Seiridium unicorne]|uniref:Chromatin associated protein KTI12 n=1 Tax=Seiridium unicorne TaxID=138068 RepID=A0ABR2VHD1_9PEZI